MTNQPDRLSQVESLLQQMAESIKQQKDVSNERMTRFEHSIAQLEQLTQSNGRAIQALTEDITTFKLAVEQDREEALVRAPRATSGNDGDRQPALVP